MKSERTYPVYKVNKHAEGLLVGGHPWVYENDILEVPGTEPENGTLVDVVSPKGAYLGTGFLSLKSKIRVRLISRNANDTFDAADLSQLEGLIKPNTKLIYVESPANPTMVLVDIAAVVEIAHKHGIKVFIDNTFATPYNTTPLDLGVDAVIHSLTKYIGGHGDLLGGAVISNDEQFLRECRLGTLMHFGSVMAPFTAFLVCRGLKTLGVRMKQYNESALKIAKWLEANPKIETVRYPFLESNPQYAIAKKQMKGGGGMISFDVAGGLEAGKKFINSLKLCTLAVSLGDTETLVEQAAAMTHTMIPKEIREAAGITDGMIRMSVGLEDPDDIIADLKQALGD